MAKSTTPGAPMLPDAAAQPMSGGMAPGIAPMGSDQEVTRFSGV